MTILLTFMRFYDDDFFPTQENIFAAISITQLRRKLIWRNRSFIHQLEKYEKIHPPFSSSLSDFCKDEIYGISMEIVVQGEMKMLRSFNMFMETSKLGNSPLKRLTNIHLHI